MPRLSSRAAIRCAPELGPTNRPNLRAMRRISAMASSESTATIVSMSAPCRAMMPGTNPSEIPSIRCLPTSPHMRVQDSLGSTATTLQAGSPRGSLTHTDDGSAGAHAADHGVRHHAGRQLARISGPSQVRFSSTFHS